MRNTIIRSSPLIKRIIFAVMLTLAGYGVVKDWRVLLGCLALGGITLLVDPMLAERLLSVFTKIDTSSEMRLAIWESSAEMIFDHPILGIGWGAYRLVYPEYDFYINDPSVIIYHAHNMYLNYAAEIGHFTGSECVSGTRSNTL